MVGAGSGTAARMSTSTTHTGETKDVVDLLLEQHAHIKDLFARVEKASPTDLHDAFEELRRFLAVHETAEELVTHPAARMAEGGHGTVVDTLLEQETGAKRLLAELDSMDTLDPRFRERLAALKEAVLAHARTEEEREFPLLLAETPAGRRERMAVALRAVEQIAPTHPHPAAGSSMTVNLLAGPLAALVDRTRDAVGRALRG